MAHQSQYLGCVHSPTKLSSVVPVDPLTQEVTVWWMDLLPVCLLSTVQTDCVYRPSLQTPQLLRPIFINHRSYWSGTVTTPPPTPPPSPPPPPQHLRQMEDTHGEPGCVEFYTGENVTQTGTSSLEQMSETFQFIWVKEKNGQRMMRVFIITTLKNEFD